MCGLAAAQLGLLGIDRTYSANWEVSAGDLGGGTSSEDGGKEDGRVLHFDGLVGFINYLSDKRMCERRSSGGNIQRSIVKNRCG